MDIALRDMGLDNSMLSIIQDILHLVDEEEDEQKLQQHPSRAFVRETKAMRSTPADIIEFPESYLFMVDMPGLKLEEIKVHLEDGNQLVVSGVRRREKIKDKEGSSGKYIKMERRIGRFLKKFILPENANTEKISADYEHGVLTLTVVKLPPQLPKKPKLIEVTVGGGTDQERKQEVGTKVEGHVPQASGTTVEAACEASGAEEGARKASGGGDVPAPVDQDPCISTVL